MGAIFGKPKANPQAQVTEQDRAILGLKLEKDKMKQALRRYNATIEKERQMAKELISQGRKDRALLMLKRKRYQETLIDKVNAQMDQIDQMIGQLEVAQMNRDVLEKLKAGNEALQLINATFSLEDAEKIMEDTAEANAFQEEISEILTGQLSASDLDDVNEELARLANENVSLPEVPTHDLPQVVAEPKEKQKAPAKKQRVALEAS